MKTKEIKEAEIKRLLKKIRESARISLSFRIKMFFRLRKKAKEMEWRTGFFTWQKALAGAVCAIFIFAGTGAFAYASPSVSNGTILYPIKRVIEKIEGRFQRTNEEQIVFHAKMMGKRIEESEKLAERGIEDKETIEIITNEFNQSIAGIDTLVEIGKQKDALRLIQKQLKKDQIEALGKLEEGIPPPIFDKRREAYGQMNARIGEHFNFIEMRVKGDEPQKNSEPIFAPTPQRIIPKIPLVPTNITNQPIRKTTPPVINPGAKPSRISPFTSKPATQTTTKSSYDLIQPISGEPR